MSANFLYLERKQCIAGSELVVRRRPRKKFPTYHCLWCLLSVTAGDEVLGWTYFMWCGINQSDMMNGLNYMLCWNCGTPHLHMPKTRELNWTRELNFHFSRKHVVMKDELRMENVSLKDWAWETFCNNCGWRKENC